MTPPHVASLSMRTTKKFGGGGSYRGTCPGEVLELSEAQALSLIVTGTSESPVDIVDVAFAAGARRDISPGAGGVEVVVTSLPGTSSSVLSSCARQRHWSQPLKSSLYPDGVSASRGGIEGGVCMSLDEENPPSFFQPAAPTLRHSVPSISLAGSRYAVLAHNRNVVVLVTKESPRPCIVASAAHSGFRSDVESWNRGRNVLSKYWSDLQPTLDIN
ncbi:hypothetical protein EDD85DRAFT_798639 [Armillaria nabsnona]|nr:hypothetical protein EDD85DRAFT_798639 [Armillaria nabsnona]